MHFWRRIAREEAIGGHGREEMESRARESRIARKEEALGPRAPNVSIEKGTRENSEEVGREE